MNPPWIITTETERDALPAEVVVRAADGTIACRHYSGMGVVFGDERPFPWSVLPLPLEVLALPGGDERFPAGTGLGVTDFTVAAKVWEQSHPKDPFTTTRDYAMSAFTAGADFATDIAKETDHA